MFPVCYNSTPRSGQVKRTAWILLKKIGWGAEMFTMDSSVTCVWWDRFYSGARARDATGLTHRLAELTGTPGKTFYSPHAIRPGAAVRNCCLQPSQPGEKTNYPNEKIEAPSDDRKKRYAFSVQQKRKYDTAFYLVLLFYLYAAETTTPAFLSSRCKIVTDGSRIVERMFLSLSITATPVNARPKRHQELSRSPLTQNTSPFAPLFVCHPTNKERLELPKQTHRYTRTYIHIHVLRSIYYLKHFVCRITNDSTLQRDKLTPVCIQIKKDHRWRTFPLLHLYGDLFNSQTSPRL